MTAGVVGLLRRYVGLPARTRKVIFTEHPINVLGDDVVSVLEPIPDGLLLRNVLVRHVSPL